MNTDLNSPLNSRARFKFKTLINIAILFAVFIPVMFVLSWITSAIFPGNLFALLAIDAVTIGTLYFVFLFWDGRPIKLVCDNCKQVILSNTPWTCSACGKVNNNVRQYPFVDKCEFCGIEPKAYRCHHCQKFIFLTEDKLEQNYAYCLNSPAEIPEPDARTVEVIKRVYEREDKKHEVVMARYQVMLAKMDARIKEIKNGAEPIKVKTPLEQKEENLKNFITDTMGARELAAKQKVENAITYKDRPDELADANHVVDVWLTKNV
jgi:hypothetical protein